jgi:hypothetical protein
MYNFDNFVYFVLLRPSNPHYGFAGGYNDLDGNLQMIVDKLDDKGRPVPRYFKFSKKERTIRIPKKQQDSRGNNVADFLRNHPECKGSVNNTGQAIWFKEINEDKDSGLAVEAKKARIEAENVAVSLKGQDLVDVAALCGLFNSKPNAMMHRVLEVAGNDPEAFMDIINDPAIKTKSLLRRGIRLELIKQKGTLLVWENTTLGVDENDAVRNLLSDAILYNAVEALIDGKKEKTIKES